MNGNPDNSHPQPVVQQHSSSTTTSNNNQMIQQPIVTTATITNQPQIPVGSVVLPGVLTLSVSSLELMMMIIHTYITL